MLFEPLFANAKSQPDQIAIIAQWINDGCPDDAPDVIGPLDVTLNGAASGKAFLIAAGGGVPGTLSMRTTDGSAGEVTLRVKAGSGAALQFAVTSVHVTGDPVTVEVTATTVSGASKPESVGYARSAWTTSQAAAADKSARSYHSGRRRHGDVSESR